MAKMRKSIQVNGETQLPGLDRLALSPLLLSDHQFPDSFRFHGVSTMNFTLRILRVTATGDSQHAAVTFLETRRLTDQAFHKPAVFTSLRLSPCSISSTAKW